ncbi:MAG: glycosyltransferase family 39 protein [Chitinispirillaceae bacterium]|nr:glycosyltransferase family 39 protein [Chitinispirillaceae bacterium]
MNKDIFRLISVTTISSAIILRLLWAYFNPSWNSPDEYPHFYVIKQLSLTNKYPISKPYFPFYEAYQPPLYYLLSAYFIYPFVKKYDISSDDYENVIDEKRGTKNYALIFLRLFSVLLSAISLIIMYKLLYVYFEDRPVLAIFSLLFYCFLPTFVNNGSTVNNDGLANLLGLTILFIVLTMSLSYRKVLFLSLTWSIGVYTKSNILPLFFIILLDLFTEDIKKKEKILYSFLFLLISILICSPYILWNLHRYANFIPINPGVTTISPLQNLHLSKLSRAVINFNWSFWAAAGRIYEIHFPSYVYLFFYLPFSLLSLLGIIKIFWKVIKTRKTFSEKNYRLKVILLMSIILEVAASLYYTLQYPIMCSWGKYVYPVLPAIAILFIEGIFESVKKNIACILSIIFIVGFMISNLWLFFKIIS